jgi:hypothetical protein
MAKGKTAAKGTGAPKTVCPLTKDEFLGAAKPIGINIGGNTYALNPQEFSTGSFGFYLSDKVTITIGDVPVKFQAGFNLTAVGSKPAPAVPEKVKE